MDRRSKWIVGFSFIALLSLAFGTWAATAHTQTYQSHLSIHHDKKSSSLWGHVGTSRFCQGGREITVFLQGSGSDTLVGTAFSSVNGMWGPVSATGSGSYYATVDEQPMGGYGADHTCLRDTSKTIRVG